ncbi:methionyl-tRNA formyltransferase [Proteiniphilum sp. X52]|uniref:methionyl-tRNA formyltransferase n=1 Tax=Proteiniphilum sp. X52 TaxID=2382159 RepID=UPI000F0A7EBA|nr:methionyl-tRNA formyltransferase [Proteiniphilum sp. X52]RNC66913.1 methionyl-tRNA formyltransferase [Proteiniphilum sp. X52]
MDKKSLRILFMGTPEFAVESLKALVENGYNVVGVVTMPDKPAGRGYKLQPSPVKQYASQRGLPVLQPEKLKDEGFLNELKQLDVDLQVVVAFRMLPEVVWAMPPKGTFNLHSSLLPQYRGAAPINWAIINGEKETGVTSFFLSHEIDTGKIIFQEKTTIDDRDNAGTLHDRLMIMGSQLVLKTVDAILKGDVQSVPQDKLFRDLSELKNAPKIFKEDCQIDWNKPAREIYNLIRGLSPYPAAWTELFSANQGEKLRFKLFAGEPIENSIHDLQPGSIETDHKTYLDVATKDGFLRITVLQMPGKKRMNTIDFLNGYHFGKEARFG